jgi:hypothetical protein
VNIGLKSNIYVDFLNPYRKDKTDVPLLRGKLFLECLFAKAHHSLRGIVVMRVRLPLGPQRHLDTAAGPSILPLLSSSQSHLQVVTHIMPKVGGKN